MRNWIHFKLVDIFSIENPDGEMLIDTIKGDTPCVTCSDMNNGVSCFVKSEKKIKGNVITVSTNGTPSSSYYQKDDFTSPRGSVIILREKIGGIMNVYIGLFIATLINKEKYKFNYGRKGENRMKNIMIKLPVTSKGKPNWRFMEDYIKSLRYSEILEKPLYYGC